MHQRLATETIDDFVFRWGKSAFAFEGFLSHGLPSTGSSKRPGMRPSSSQALLSAAAGSLKVVSGEAWPS